MERNKQAKGCWRRKGVNHHHWSIGHHHQHTNKQVVQVSIYVKQQQYNNLASRALQVHEGEFGRVREGVLDLGDHRVRAVVEEEEDHLAVPMKRGDLERGSVQALRLQRARALEHLALQPPPQRRRQVLDPGQELLGQGQGALLRGDGERSAP